MTARITSGQVKQLGRFMEDSLTGLNLTREGVQRVIAQGGVLQAQIQQVLVGLANEFFIPVPDTEVPEQQQTTLAKYRALATECGVPATVAVAYRVAAGFTLKSLFPNDHVILKTTG